MKYTDYSQLAIDGIYFYGSSGTGPYIFRNCGRSGYNDNMSIGLKVWYTGSGSFSDSTPIRDCTPEEIEWYLICEERKEFVPYKEVEQKIKEKLYEYQIF